MNQSIHEIEHVLQGFIFANDSIWEDPPGFFFVNSEIYLGQNNTIF